MRKTPVFVRPRQLNTQKQNTAVPAAARCETLLEKTVPYERKNRQVAVRIVIHDASVPYGGPWTGQGPAAVASGESPASMPSADETFPRAWRRTPGAPRCSRKKKPPRHQCTEGCRNEEIGKRGEGGGRIVLMSQVLDH